MIRNRLCPGALKISKAGIGLLFISHRGKKKSISCHLSAHSTQLAYSLQVASQGKRIDILGFPEPPWN